MAGAVIRPSGRSAAAPGQRRQELIERDCATRARRRLAQAFGPAYRGFLVQGTPIPPPSRLSALQTDFGRAKIMICRRQICLVGWSRRARSWSVYGESVS